MPQGSGHPRALIFLLLAALVLRLAYALSQDHLIVYLGVSGDPPYYLGNGEGLLSGLEHGLTSHGLSFYNSQIPSAPLYLVFTGIWQKFLPDQAAVIAIRIAQSFASVVVCYFAYRIARVLTNDERAGLLVLAILAVHPSFVLDAAEIATETLYLFFLMAGMWLYIEWIIAKQPEAGSRFYSNGMIGAVGLAFGLATLTRAVALLFPLTLVAHLFLVYGKSQFRPAVLLLSIYVAVVGIWTVANLVRWEEPRFVIASNQMMAAFWRGTVVEDVSPQDIDRRLLGELEDENCVVDCKNKVSDEAFWDAAQQTIASDLMAYIRLRVSRLGYSYLQPHSTLFLGGKSAREQATGWLSGNRSVSGFVELIRTERFGIKLIIYVFHYSGLIAGLVGIWSLRDRWQVGLPLVGFILYTTMIHLFLAVIPRYIFPTQAFFWIFAAAALIRSWDGSRDLWGRYVSVRTGKIVTGKISG